MDWSRGYVRVPRTLLTGGELERLGALVDLIGLAAWDPDGPLPRGALEESVGDLERRWSWHRSRVKRLLRWLESEGVIRREPGTGRSPTRTTFVQYDPSDTDRPPQALAPQGQSSGARPSTERGTLPTGRPSEGPAALGRLPDARPSTVKDRPSQGPAALGESSDTRPTFFNNTDATRGVVSKASSERPCECGRATLRAGDVVCSTCRIERAAADFRLSDDMMDEYTPEAEREAIQAEADYGR